MSIPQQLAAIVFNPTSYADSGLIDRTFAELRRVAPLAQAEIPGFEPIWLVTRHADIQEVSRKNDLFHSGDRSDTLIPLAFEDEARKRRAGNPNLVRSLVAMDNPDHKKHRLITQMPLMRQNVAKLEEKVRETARKYVDRFLASGGANDGECDFAADVAFQYPLEVVMDLVGVPQPDQHRMLQLTQWLFGSYDPDLRRPIPMPQTPVEAIDQADAVCQMFREFYEPIVADRRTNPQPDLASLIANAKIDGCPMGDWETISYFIIASTAGHDTTSATTATGMWVLAERPDLLRRLHDNPSLINGFVDETIRWASPVKHFIRSATEDTELAGQKIAKGDQLMLCYPSGNRDEAVFDDPYTFNPDRSPNPHLSFGYGGHVCIGQHLARMEMRVFWEELLPRITTLELADKAELMIGNFVVGPKKVPVRFSVR